MSKLLIHQERSINRSSWKPKRKCTWSKEYIGSFSKKYEKKRKRLKNKKKRKIRKKDILKSSSKREYNKDSLMRKKIKKRYIIQKAHGRWPWLVTTFGWWSMFKNKKNIFWAFISFSSQPYNLDHITSPIKSILIVEWLQWFSYNLAL